MLADFVYTLPILSVNPLFSSRPDLSGYAKSIAPRRKFFSWFFRRKSVWIFAFFITSFYWNLPKKTLFFLLKCDKI